MKFFLAASLFSFVFCAPVLAGSSPKLIVILVGDQIRADYMERYHDDLAPDGLRRFREHGAYFNHAEINHVVTKTSPGHVLIGSGLSPSESGIVNNEWYDPVLGHTVSAAEMSPGGRRVRLRWFEGVSFAQRLHKIHPHSRVISLSLKDRGALLLTGPDQDAAYWWNNEKKGFVGYAAAEPSWLARFNSQVPSWLPEDKRWDLLKPISPDLNREFQKTSKWTAGHVRNRWGMGLQFPHSLPSLEAVMNSPFSDDILERLAEIAAQEWNLGSNPDGDPDVLTVSFSAVDLVGHEYGPDSPEARDAFLRLDCAIAKLMNFLEKRNGSEILWVFSSDHGVTPFPEIAQAQGLPAGRVQLNKDSISPPGLIEAVSLPFIYLNESVAQKQSLPREKVLMQLSYDLKKMEGIDKVYTESEIRKRQVPLQILRSFYLPKAKQSKRCGDLIVTLKPRYIFADDDYGTTHGQPTLDDQRVPLGFYGLGVHALVHNKPISPGVVAPTLLKILNIPMPGETAPLDIPQ